MALTARVKIALLAAAILAFFLAVLLMVLPTVLVNKAETRAALQQRLSALLGGEVTFEQVKITLFPRVCATIGHPRIDLPGKLSARAAEFDLCLKLLPLLRGRVVADSIKAQSPEIHLPVSPIGLSGGGPGLPDPRQILSQMLDRLKHIPETRVEVIDGRLGLAEAGKNRFEFRHLNLQFKHDGPQLEWSLRGESDFLKAFSSRGRLDTDSYRGTIALQLTDLRLRPVHAFFWPDARLQVVDTRADLDLALNLEGRERLEARVIGKAPVLTLSLDRREMRLAVERLAADIELTETKLAVSVPEFSSSLPRASLELGFVLDQETHPRIDIRLKGHGDSTGAREFTLAALHEFPDARLLCDIVRGGEVPDISVSLRGDTWDDLADLKNLLITGRLEKGGIYLPWVDLDLNEVYGDARIEGGILEGRNMKARHQGVRGENGTLRVGLTKAEPVLQLDIFIQGELSGLPRFLAEVVPDPDFRREMALIQEFSGTAAGTLHLDGTHEDVSVGVQAAQIDVKARYQPIPYPLAFKGGRFRYGNDGVGLQEVDVSIGSSKLSRINLVIGGDLARDPHLEASAPEAVVDLSEAFHMGRGIPPFDSFRDLGGTAIFREAHLTGKATEPETWQFNSRGAIHHLHLDAEPMPAPLRVASGPFEWQASVLRCEGWDARLGEALITGLAGELDWRATPTLSLRADRISAPVAELYSLLKSHSSLDPPLEPFAPLAGTIQLKRTESRVSFPRGQAPLVQFNAVLNTSSVSSPRLESPLEIRSGRILFENPRIEVQDVDAALGKSEIRRLRLNADWADGGSLDLAADSAVIRCEDIFPVLATLPALEALREDIASLQGTVTISEPRLNGPIRDPRRWRLHAGAEYRDIVITATFLNEPMEVPTGRLTATEAEIEGTRVTALRLDSTRVQIGTDRGVVAGEITFFPTETRLDLNVTAEALDWNKIEKISEHIAQRRQGEGIPVRGRLGVRVEYLAFDRFSLYPFYADALFAPEGTRLAIERAGFCGMVFIGRVAFDVPMVDAYLVPVVDGMNLDSVVSCLTNEKSQGTGNFNLDGALQVTARREEIAKALNGRLTFVSDDGTILRSLFFARLFSLLNLTEIYRGQFPDFTSQGLDYKRTTAALEIKDGKILVPEWSIDGRTLWMGSRGEIDIATLEIDFTIMVSPFKTIDRIINAIPGIRWILGGRLIAIPMKATGTLDDPQILPLSPSAVGTSILEMIERTLLLPIEIIQPLVPGMEQPGSGTITK
jgi:hypothetical protein